MVTNIRESKTTLELATNAGPKTTKQEVADIPGFSTVWYNKTAKANIFGLSDLKKKHKITFDSEKEDAFIVHTDDGNMKFKCNPKGWYTFEVSNRYLKKEKPFDQHSQRETGLDTPRDNLNKPRGHKNIINCGDTYD
jgi:hypothetical protein